MRVKLQLVICHDDNHEETVTDIITLDKTNQRIEHLGLSLAESKQLLSTIQRHLLPTTNQHFSRRAVDVLGLRHAAQAQGPWQQIVSQPCSARYKLGLQALSPEKLR